jgi:hypothetical protein
MQRRKKPDPPRLGANGVPVNLSLSQFMDAAILEEKKKAKKRTRLKAKMR